MRFGASSCNVLDSLVSVQYDNLNEDCPHEVKYNDSVNLVNVSHKYQKEIILNNININIASKDFVAIIGNSGSGKTTLLNIILGLIKPEIGNVVSNNISIYKSEKTWRSNIGYVPQSINLIDKNIFKNIALGQMENLINKQKINTLLKDLSIADLIQDSNEKEFALGENANKISGGQNQRIGIAKALYRDPKILILDEFTSALDEENQDKILKLIKKLDITVIMATHRLNSLSYCNKVFEIRNHKLVQIK
jgi:ABC-type bacteriocin/lantibiotic exporter with double-glycine peptidase domain